VVFYHAESKAEMGRVIAIDPQNPDAADVAAVAEVVRAGAVILYPTDTVYGLGCDFRNHRALQRIFEIKGRDEGKGVLLLVPDMKSVARLSWSVPEIFERLAARFWPGPVTFLLPARSSLPGLIRGERGLIGVRNPDCPYLRLLLKRSGPLVSTSANLSGHEPPQSVNQLKGLLLDHVDLLIDGGDAPGSLPSTVVDLTETPPQIVRSGTLAASVQQFLEPPGKRDTHY
jgi:L-threonylcarbamoyladenylate synthase